MSRHFKHHANSYQELNITPLLDLVIVLLMIFIIAAPQLTNELELNLPSNKKQPAPPSKPPEIQYIGIAPDGQITLNQKSCTLDALKPNLIQLHTENPDVNIVINGDEEADYEMVVSILDVLYEANITHIGMATDGARSL